jgi:hypothetical protein
VSKINKEALINKMEVNASQIGKKTSEISEKVKQDVAAQLKNAADRWCSAMFATQYLGNTLSIYWGGRVFATFAGLPFKFQCPVDQEPSKAWINQLPSSGPIVASVDATEAAARSVLRECQLYRMHECRKWVHPVILQQIRAETETALMAQLVLDQNDANKDPKLATMPAWANMAAEAQPPAADWAAIHFRCGDALRGALAPTYGVLPNKWYTDILTNHSKQLKRIVVVAKLQGKGDHRELDKGTGSECRYGH